MPRPSPADAQPAPSRCPQCGGTRLGPVRPADVEVWPLDPEEAPDAYPGLLECRRCGTIVQWGA